MAGSDAGSFRALPTTCCDLTHSIAATVINSATTTKSFPGIFPASSNAPRLGSVCGFYLGLCFLSPPPSQLGGSKQEHAGGWRAMPIVTAPFARVSSVISAMRSQEFSGKCLCFAKYCFKQATAPRRDSLSSLKEITLGTRDRSSPSSKEPWELIFSSAPAHSSAGQPPAYGSPCSTARSDFLQPRDAVTHPGTPLRHRRT